MLALPPPCHASIVGHGQVTSVRACGKTLERVHAPARILDVDAAGRRVAWTVRRGRTVVLREANAGRIVVRRTIYRGPPRSAPPRGVAVTTRGDLAWTARKVVLKRAGGAAIAAGDGFGTWLGFEDDRTLRWEGADERFRYRDLRPPAQRDGCPLRERFARIAENDQVLVTKAEYGGPQAVESHELVRVCLRGSGRDRLEGQADAFGFDGGESFYVGGLDGPRVALALLDGSRSTAGITVRAVDARTGATLRAASQPGAPLPLPDPGKAVVTERGVPVWLSTVGATVFVHAAAPDGTISTLDSGTIANLRSDGARVEWTNAGAPRSAEPA